MNHDTPDNSRPDPGPRGEAIPPLDRLLAERTELHCREQLSALLDGALPADEARFLLRRLQHDRALSGHWERWQVYGDALRGSASTLLPADFAQRVAAALVEDGQVQAVAATASAPSSRPRWLRFGGGAALAASVALAALFVAQRAPAPTQGGAPALELASSGATGSADPQPSAPARSGDPSTPAGGAAGTLAAATLAMAEVPRRIARRDRQATPRRAVAVAQPSGASAGAPAIARDDAASAAVAFAASEAARQADPFVGDGALIARPWPRAVLPSMSASPLTVDYGRLPSQISQPQGADVVFEPFAPQVPVEAAAPGTP